MTVNPFWFGVLMTLVAEIVAVLLFAIIGSHRGIDDREDREFQEALASLEGKRVRIVRKNGYLIGEMVDDEDEEED